MVDPLEDVTLGEVSLPRMVRQRSISPATRVPRILLRLPVPPRSPARSVSVKRGELFINGNMLNKIAVTKHVNNANSNTGMLSSMD